MTGTAATLWFETMAMTALLIAAVLLVRRPFAALFGPRIAYALWLIPLLRLVLPPLPGGDTIVAASQSVPEFALDIGAPVSNAAAYTASFDPAALLAVAPFIWLAGFVAVLGMTLLRHHHWLRQTLVDATPLDSVGRVRLVMSAGVDGPVATGLLRPLIAVPKDFFARYNRAERALAIEHELAHHRAGDLWANAAALLVLAAQWFNPLAWWALGAFRFDQEAACDARILGAVAAPERAMQAHHYARAIAKSRAGPRLLLAAPMTSGKAVKERLHMLSRNPQAGARPLLGRVLLGGTAFAALALTISTLPDRVVFAAEPAADTAAVAPATAEKRSHRVLIVETSDDTKDATAPADGVKREVHRLFIHSNADAAGKPRVMMFNGDEVPIPDGAEIARSVQQAMPFFGLDEKELRAALTEQGVDGAKADAVIAKLREKRAAEMSKHFAWSADDARTARAVAIAPCSPGHGQRVMIDRDGVTDGKARVRMIGCGGAEIAKDKQVEAMKKARDRMAAEKDGHGMSAEIRASVVADLDKAIAEIEAQKDN
jgi:bla regulator protein blaR1